MMSNSALTQDRQAINLVLNGDVDHFEILVRKYRDKVFRYLIKNFTEPSLAEDLTQDTFLEAFRNLDKFRGESSFSTWLIGIALNLSRNHFRKNRKNMEQTLHTHAQTDQSRIGTNPLDILESNKHIASLKNEICKLPGGMREVLILVSLEEYTYEETSKIANIPIGTVKSRVFKAREMLREAMKKLEKGSN